MKTILITGGTGFLGKNLAMSLKDNYNIILSGRNHLRISLAQKETGCRVIPLDVVNIESIRDAFSEIKPDIIIHAAAVKYIDLAETYPNECIDINILGSQNIARVAIEKGIDIVIGISTDKATPPCRSVYGLSKSIMEKLFCNLSSKSKTKFSCIRLGNVAWSTGSVFHLWMEMIQKKGEIMSTGLNMSRFFCTIDQATFYIETLIENIKVAKGKIFIPEFKSVTIKYLLEFFIHKYSGTYKAIEERPGERNHEILIGEIELPFSLRIKINDNNYFLVNMNKKTPKPILKSISSQNASQLTDTELKFLLTKPMLL